MAIGKIWQPLKLVGKLIAIIFFKSIALFFLFGLLNGGHWFCKDLDKVSFSSMVTGTTDPSAHFFYFSSHYLVGRDRVDMGIVVDLHDIDIRVDSGLPEGLALSVTPGFLSRYVGQSNTNIYARHVTIWVKSEEDKNNFQDRIDKAITDHLRYLKYGK